MPPIVYRVFYCMAHDQGFVVQGDDQEPNEACKRTVCGDAVALCNVELHRTLNVACGDVHTVIHVDGYMDYRSRGGGWSFDKFAKEVMNLDGVRMLVPALSRYFGSGFDPARTGSK
jgi:hypothetical protein